MEERVLVFVAKNRRKLRRKRKRNEVEKNILPNGKDVSFLKKILWGHFHESGTGDQSPVLERLEWTNFRQNRSSLTVLPEIGLDPSHLLALACGELDVISKVVSH